MPLEGRGACKPCVRLALVTAERVWVGLTGPYCRSLSLRYLQKLFVINVGFIVRFPCKKKKQHEMHQALCCSLPYITFRGCSCRAAGPVVGRAAPGEGLPAGWSWPPLRLDLGGGHSGWMGWSSSSRCLWVHDPSPQKTTRKEAVRPRRAGVSHISQCQRLSSSVYYAVGVGKIGFSRASSLYSYIKTQNRLQ